MEYIRETRKLISDVDGLELDLMILAPKGKVKGIFQIHHGMSEYKERYLPFMEYLAGEGYAAAFHACRGHGKSVRSQGVLGYMYGGGGSALVEDAHQVTVELRKRWSDVPLILFGHSMGSLVVRMYTKTYDKDIDMLVVCGSPSKNDFLRAGKCIASAQNRLFGSRHISKLLEAASFGAFAKPFAAEKSRFAWCCSDPEVVREYEESPLCGFTFTVDGYQALFQLMEETYSVEGWALNNPGLPVLFVGGADDPCIGGARKYARAVQMMRRVGYKNTKGRLYPGMRHEILNEKDRQRVFLDIRRYAEKQLRIND